MRINSDTASEKHMRLDAYRSYLMLLTRLNSRNLASGHLDASDVVQQTLLKAHQALQEFRGTDSKAMGAWLRQILRRTLSDAIRDRNCGKRDAALERSLDAGIEDSTCRLEGWLAAEQPSPSAQAMQGERLLGLAAALEALPEAQRDALVLKHCEGLTVDEVAERIGRTPAAVASLLRRGLKHLREQLKELE